MDRIEGVDQAELDALIAAEMEAATHPEYGDHDLTELINAAGFPTSNPRGVYADRRTRGHIAYYLADDGSWQETRLKQFDHIEMSPGAYAVVAMPARGRQYFLAYAPEYYGAQLVTLPWSLVTDRAPVIEGEAPMPLDEPLPEPPAPEVDELSRLRGALTHVLKAMLALLGR
jgi:hypothetical protein